MKKDVDEERVPNVIDYSWDSPQRFDEICRQFGEGMGLYKSLAKGMKSNWRKDLETLESRRCWATLSNVQSGIPLLLSVIHVPL